MRKLLFIIVLFFFSKTFSQELQANVVINSALINQTNQQVFKTLEKAINEFINSQRWTDEVFLPEERIRCNFIFTINSYNNDTFQGTLQIQAERPVYGTSYRTVTFNYLDKEIGFKYQEFQPIIYNPNAFQGDLAAMISYYIYIVLGMDAATYQKQGGEKHFRAAQRITAFAQQSNVSGWKQVDGNRNRYWLIDNLIAGIANNYWEGIYSYYREGLDKMLKNNKEAKESIAESFLLFEKYNQRYPNNMLLTLFFEAKVQEIVAIFSGGEKTDTKSVENTLKTIAPFFSSSWRKIK